MNNLEWIKIGEVGVDSGGLMLCDPSYINGMWQKGEYMDIRLYKDKSTGKMFAYDTKHSRMIEEDIEYFNNFETILSTGKTPNKHNADNEWENININDESFSYNGVKHTGKKLYKQINYPLGHAGLAVAFNSGLGDGCYDVLAKIYRGSILEVKVVMSSVEEVDES